MRLLLWAIPVLVGCTLISDADQFVGESDGGTDAGGDTGDAQQADSGVSDAGVADADAGTPDGNCTGQVEETSDDRWEDGRCCFSPDHCTGLLVQGTIYAGRCPQDGCGQDPPIASICLPSLVAVREEFGPERCYLDRDCPGEDRVCRLGDMQQFGEFASTTCPNTVPNPGQCEDRK